MNKREFIANLRARLRGLPRQDVEEHLNFYIEMIDDRMEEGLSEQEAILKLGSVGEIAKQIIADIPLIKIAKEKIKPKRQLRAWEIILLALGSPIWLSLAVAAFAVIISLYAVLWSVIISIWAVFVSLACCAPCGIVAGVVLALGGNGFTGIATGSVSVFCAGLSIFVFFGCKAATKGALLLTKEMALGTKKCFVKKEKM